MICEKFGWSWDYVNHEIPFNTIKKIFLDLPEVEYEDAKGEEGEGEIKEQSAAQFAAMMNSFTL